MCLPKPFAKNSWEHFKENIFSITDKICYCNTRAVVTLVYRLAVASCQCHNPKGMAPMMLRLTENDSDLDPQISAILMPCKIRALSCQCEYLINKQHNLIPLISAAVVNEIYNPLRCDMIHSLWDMNNLTIVHLRQNRGL